MQNAHALNLGLSGSGGNPEPPRVEDEFSRTREMVEQTRNEARRARLQVERQQEQYDAQQRRTKILSIILGILIVCLGGTVWYAYPMWQGQQKAIGEMVGLQTVAGALGQRLTSAEAKLTEMTGGLPALSNRMDQLQAGMKTNLQTARTQAQIFATQVGQQIRADVSQSMQLIQSRLGGLESNQKESASARFSVRKMPGATS